MQEQKQVNEASQIQMKSEGAFYCAKVYFRDMKQLHN